MKEKEVKEILNVAFKLTKIKQRLEREYILKRLQLDNISIEYRDTKSNSLDSKTEVQALKLIELKNNIQEYDYKINNAKNKIFCLIEKVENIELKNLLRLRYLEFNKWEDIAYILNYSKQHTHRLHNKVLKKLTKICRLLERKDLY